MGNTILVYALPVCNCSTSQIPHNCCNSRCTFPKRSTLMCWSFVIVSLLIMCHIVVPKCSVFIIILLFFYLQITLWQIGYTPAPRGRSDALILNTRLSNWKRSFCLICILLETAGSRSQGSWIWPRGRSKSGFRTGEWRWRKWTKKRPTAKNNNVDCSQKTHHNNH